MANTVINSATYSTASYLKKIYNRREIIITLAARDIKVRYAQTVLGLLWAIIQPLTGVAVFSFFFSYLVNMDTGDIPYSLFAMTGIISWNYFSYIVSNGGTALITSQILIKRVSFPKINILLSKVLVGMVEVAVAFSILLIWMIVVGYPLKSNILLLPVVFFVNIIAGLSIAMWLSALTVRFRDLQHVIPFLLTFGIWFTPVFYPTTLIPDKISFIVYLNPMAGIIESLRYCMLGTAFPGKNHLISMCMLAILFVSSFIYFKNTEKKIADFM
jgi:lipopolysaccharide transport system permease protein